MNRFQKAAIFLVRLLGSVCLLFGVSGLAYSGILTVSQDVGRGGMTNGYSLMSGAFYLILGVVLLFLSRPLGKLLGKGLDD